MGLSKFLVYRNTSWKQWSFWYCLCNTIKKKKRVFAILCIQYAIHYCLNCTSCIAKWVIAFSTICECCSLQREETYPKYIHVWLCNVMHMLMCSSDTAIFEVAYTTSKKFNSMQTHGPLSFFSAFFFSVILFNFKWSMHS